MPSATTRAMQLDDVSPFEQAAAAYTLAGIYLPGDTAAMPSIPAAQNQQQSGKPLNGAMMKAVADAAGKDQPSKLAKLACSACCELSADQCALQEAALSTVVSGVEWHDAQSVLSEVVCQQQQQQQQQQQDLQPHQQTHQQPANWVPDTPLAFAEPGLRFVPVPKVTGFAGYWEVDQERTTPHPQPIDVMIGASFIVRKVHKSIQGMAIGETDGQLTVAGQPTFMPPGLPAAYCEVYDKTNSAESTWTPRRDLKLGSCSGKIYMTDTGMVVLRIEARAAFSGRVEFIVEDYLTLEEGGQVIVDRMCCLEVATGRRATQLQVARLRPDKS